jgi:recombination associated protein RdgC
MNFHLVCARTQQKLLPVAAIREVLDEKILEIETAEGREAAQARTREPQGRDDPDAAATRADTLATELCVPRRQHAVCCSSTRRIAARAEDLLNLLRDSLGRLPVQARWPRGTARWT